LVFGDKLSFRFICMYFHVFLHYLNRFVIGLFLLCFEVYIYWLMYIFGCHYRLPIERLVPEIIKFMLSGTPNSAHCALKMSLYIGHSHGSRDNPIGMGSLTNFRRMGMRMTQWEWEGMKKPYVPISSQRKRSSASVVLRQLLRELRRTVA